MADVVLALGIKRDDKNFLYFVNGNGQVLRRSKHTNAVAVIADGIKRDNAYLYYVDKNGHVARSKRKGAK